MSYSPLLSYPTERSRRHGPAGTGCLVRVNIYRRRIRAGLRLTALPNLASVILVLGTKQLCPEIELLTAPDPLPKIAGKIAC